MPTRNLSTPELLVIASVITGQLDEHWTSHPSFAVQAWVEIGGHPQINLTLHRDGTTDEDRAAWLEHLAEALGTTVRHPSGPHTIASVHLDDWQGTGIAVDAAARTRDLEKTLQEAS
ncbi:hypothetical protein O4J56_06855 [Nocardiopsis sp. RSe5-2]|uniref:Pterin-4-alpha-carbinolamine dehydratase n=1 Tax=Nocardiopsis endophytica TaxID=3018445 RepID=A0ABT4U082_9ACTN|nr:hypothetical protein [Nocardiopsis endophytica]MDA2810354.1 hypothetical protein [Nocardiopsis endophytica]